MGVKGVNKMHMLGAIVSVPVMLSFVPKDSKRGGKTGWIVWDEVCRRQ